MDDSIIDLIYEAAIVQDTWTAVLQKLSTKVAAIGGVVFASNEVRADTWMASPSLQPAMTAIVHAGLADKLIRPQRLISRRHAGFLSDPEFMTPEEKAHDHLFQTLLIPAGLEWVCGTVVPVPNGDMLSFGFQRKSEVGTFDRKSIDLLDSLRPHLARSALIAARLQMERVKTTTDTLQAIGLAGAALSSSGRVLATNSLFADLSGPIHIGPFDRLLLKQRSANELLQAAIAGIGTEEGAKVRSIAIPATEQTAAMVGHLVPVRRQAGDVFAAAAALFVCTLVATPAVPYAGILCGLFDLTPAEEKVARTLAEGHSVESCAAALGIARETVRTHLKSVMSKTGTTRQAELIGLMSGSTSFPLPR